MSKTYGQAIITLPAYSRGVHLITSYVEEALEEILPCGDGSKIGLVNLFLQHTSASLAINENADPDVRIDTEAWLNQTAKEDEPYYLHTYEGSDDMPAHLKSMMFGVSQTIPLVNGELGLGIWQGIYLCEHRNHGGRRSLVVTVSC